MPRLDAEPRPGFGRLWTACVVSRFGDGLRSAALPLLAARLSDDPGDVAWVAAAGFLPWLLLALPAGVLVDRTDRGRLLWSTDAARAVVMGAFSIAALTGQATIPLLAGLAFMLTACQTLSETAFQSMLPAVVPPADLPRANSRLSAGEVVTERLAGPSLGGLLLARLPAAPFVVDAVSFAASAVMLSPFDGGRRRPTEPPATKAGLLGPIVDGLLWLRGDRVLLLACCYFTIWNLVLAGTTAVTVLWARETLGLSEAQYGLLFVAPAVGGLAGALAAPGLTGRLGAHRVLVVSMLGLVACFGGLGLAPHALVAGAFLALDGVMGGLWNVVGASLRQALVPEGLMGRVTSAFRFFGRGVRPVGAVLGGVMATAYGLRAPFLAAAVLLAIPALLALPLLATPVPQPEPAGSTI